MAVDQGLDPHLSACFEIRWDWSDAKNKTEELPRCEVVGVRTIGCVELRDDSLVEGTIGQAPFIVVPIEPLAHAVELLDEGEEGVVREQGELRKEKINVELRSTVSALSSIVVERDAP